jgi:hypothetical protein
VEAPNGHNLAKILKKFGGPNAPFELRLSPETRSFFDYLDALGRFRYFEGSWYVQGIELVHLDRAVWEVRRYVRPMRYELTTETGGRVDPLPLELDRVQRAESDHPHEFSIPGGKLEEILADRKHPARPALVWQNGFFGRSRRKTVRMPFGLHAANAPLTLHPELLDLAAKYAYIPSDMAAAYRDMARQRAVEKSQEAGS